ncbi:hypothetical protein [Effusibacillus lacus]|uniref:Uncharacterized protein n=1 Tax=Effusibacillus lacus TaxID=1348429 RepID=A0A292YNF3_9BACL|nr:hypothetical protein [Effusibacillus lacus]TCS68162.1 hypothetical protein EDD64_14514 [Effusibacillus lacus]GAX90293.1 hypothetical protein EFBL_1919 [Effusibacillus lacus]
MKSKLFTILLILLGILGVGMFGYSLAKQTQMQGEMNQIMASVNESIVATGTLVQETLEVLQPFQEITASLASIEQQEEQVVVQLAVMNGHLETTGLSEKNIIAGLEALNQQTRTVSQYLNGMSDVNSGLLKASSASVQNASRINGQLGEINGMTGQSIEELGELNEKFALLRILP